MDEHRLRMILADELAKTEGLPSNAAEHLDTIRTGELAPGIRAAVNAMRRAIEEDRSDTAK
jgi:hypothetical protein